MTRTLRALLPRLEELDRWLLGSVLLLCLLGSVMVFGAASYRISDGGGGWDHSHYLVRHLTRLGIGLVALVVLIQVDYRLFRTRWVGWALAGGGLAMVALPVALRFLGFSDASHARWVYLFGVLPVQPLEAAKIGLVLLLARLLGEPARPARPAPAAASGESEPGEGPLGPWARTRRLWRRAVALLPPEVPPATLLVPAAMVVLLVLQPNFGNALVMAVLTAVLLFAAGVRLRFLGTVAAAVLAAGLLAAVVVPKVHNRVAGWWAALNGGEGPYQVEQSLIGLGAGGWHGVGIGGSHQRFWFLPESHTDFIFAVLGEELGLLGTLGVLALFAIFAWRGIGIAARAAEPFGRLVATGLVSLIFLYVAANLAMVVGLFPVIGVPLPFVSYGGSALVTNLAAVGILLNIDRQGRVYQQWRSRWRRLPGQEEAR